MRKRNDLSILAVSEILTSSTDLALQIVQAREQEAEDTSKGRGLSVPWPVLLAGGATIAALFAYMKEVEEEVTGTPASDTDSTEDSTDSEVVPVEEDNEESLLDKLVSWLKDIPDTKATPKTVPAGPAINSTNKGESLVNSSRSFTAPEGVNGTVASYILKAASAVGIDPSLLFTVAKVESNFKTSEVNKITGATGLFQFIPSTWSWLIKKYPHLGFTAEDIRNPEKNALMGAVYLKSIQDTLTKALGRAVSPVELYMGHFLGPSGAIRFLRALMENPRAIAARMFPKAAKANKNIFYDGKKELTLAEVMDKMSGKISPAHAEYAGLAPTKEVAPPIAAPVVASGDSSYVPQPVNTAAPISIGSASAATNKKVALRAPEPSAPTMVAEDDTPKTAAGSSGKKVQDSTYYRDRNGTLILIPT